jgi:hypothetical protein
MNDAYTGRWSLVITDSSLLYARHATFGDSTYKILSVQEGILFLGPLSYVFEPRSNLYVGLKFSGASKDEGIKRQYWVK